MRQVDLSAFIETVRRKDLAVRGMRVFRDGQLAASYQPGPERRQNQYSGTKSFTATAVGFAVQEGMFSLDDRVLDHFRADGPEAPSENLQKMTLRHLLTMSMGVEQPLLMGDMRPRMKEKDWVKFVLRAPVVHEPGSLFRYTNAGPYLLGVLIQRLSGMSLAAYLGPRLFEPLGIRTPEYERDPMGYDFGSSGMCMTVSEFAKLGLLYLQKGVYNGVRLLDESWVEAASAPQIETDEGDGELGRHYGYLFWVMPDGMYRADGMYGQYCVIVPKKNAVITINSMQEKNTKQILRAALRTVLPQL